VPNQYIFQKLAYKPEDILNYFEHSYKQDKKKALEKGADEVRRIIFEINFYVIHLQSDRHQLKYGDVAARLEQKLLYDCANARFEDEEEEDLELNSYYQANRLGFFSSPKFESPVITKPALKSSPQLKKEFYDVTLTPARDQTGVSLLAVEDSEPDAGCCPFFRR
jgi:hypothetical protein